MWVYVEYRGGPAHGHRAWTLMDFETLAVELVKDEGCYTVRRRTIAPHDGDMRATYVYDPRR